MRARVTVLCAAIAALLLLSGYVVTWVQVSDTRERGSDFSTWYVAALLVRDGHGAQLYDQAAELQRHESLLPPGYRVNLPFVTPPTAAVLALPFTLLDPGSAARLFSAIEVLVLLVAIWIAIRAGPWPAGLPRGARGAVALVALGGVPTFVLLLIAQADALCALGIACGFAAWRRGNRDAAGFAMALGFLALKPHLAVGIALFLLARREWRALAGAAAAAAMVGAVSLVLVGPSGLRGFLSVFSYSLATTPAASTLGLPGLVASWLGTGTGAGVLAALASVAALGGCIALGARSRGADARFEYAFAGALALSLALSPHLLGYDFVSLAPAFVLCMARAATEDGVNPWPGRRSLLVAGAWVAGNALLDMDVGNAAQAPPGRVAPVALVLVAALAWRTLAPVPVTRRKGRLLLQPGSGSGAGGSVE